MISEMGLMRQMSLLKVTGTRMLMNAINFLRSVSSSLDGSRICRDDQPIAISPSSCNIRVITMDLSICTDIPNILLWDSCYLLPAHSTNTRRREITRPNETKTNPNNKAIELLSHE